MVERLSYKIYNSKFEEIQGRKAKGAKASTCQASQLPKKHILCI